jgi:dolichyl-phosphate beta-glucosyltransferase
MGKKIYLSVVIPAYNEEESIKNGVLEKVYGFLSKQNLSWDLTIVDDGSTDKTVKLIEKFIKNHKNVKLQKEPHRGKGGTVIAGMLSAKGETILFTDMDQATPITEILKFLPKFREGVDVVIGSRTGRAGAPLVRKVMAFGFVIVRTVILRLPFKDTQCGFKALKRKAAKDIFKRMEIFSEKRAKGAAVTAGFDIEFLYIARKLGYKIAEVPVAWNYGERKKVNPLRDSIDATKDILKIRINSILGKYNI